jgi:hypothetical protein
MNEFFPQMINDHSFKCLVHLRLSTYVYRQYSVLRSIFLQKTTNLLRSTEYSGTWSTCTITVPKFPPGALSVLYTGVRPASRVCQAKILLHSTSEPPNQNAKKNLVRDATLKRCGPAALCKCMLCTRSTEYSGVLGVRVIEIESSTTSL